MSTVGSRTTSGTPSAFLILLAGDVHRAEVGDGGGHDDDVGVGGPGEDGVVHLGGGVDRDDVDRRRCRRRGRS